MTTLHEAKRSTTIAAPFRRGSEWRKWDLHVHTPESALNSQYLNWDSFVQALFTKAVERKIAAIGITDYFFVDGIKKLRLEYLEQKEVMAHLFAQDIQSDPDFLQKVHSILLFPCIELRINKLVPTRGNGKAKRLTIHVVFADDVDPCVIESDFLGALKFTLKGAPDGRSDERALTRANVEELGRELKSAQPSLEGTELFVGCKNLYFDDELICKKLVESALFRTKHLVLLAEENTALVSWEGQGHQIRKVLTQQCHMLLSSNPGTVEWAKSDGFRQEFGGPRPCIWGCDAHTENELFEVAEDRFCWVKSDVTFSGLKQLTNEPDRVHLGIRPPGLGEFDDRIWINELNLQSAPGVKLGDEKWFQDVSLPLNRDLVALIGNKGSGKTALVDILALLGNTRIKPAYFGFLTDQRFKNSSAGRQRASGFTATARMNTGATHSKRLDESPRADAPELVTYLPQGYLEHICSEAGDEAAGDFTREIERVIFSHVSQADRLGKSSLAELIDFRTEEIFREISRLKQQTRDLNRRNLELHAKKNPEVLRSLEQQIVNKEQEIAHLEKQKPTEVAKPQSPTEGQVDPRVEELAAIRKQIAEIEVGIVAWREKLSQAKSKVAVTEKLLATIANFEKQYQAFVDGTRSDFASIGLDPSVCVKLMVELQPVEASLAAARLDIQASESQLSEEFPAGLAGARKTLLVKAADVEKMLQGPHRDYENYLKGLKAWEDERKTLVGAEKVEGTLENLKTRLTYLQKTLPSDLEALRQERRLKVLEIHANLREQANIAADYYKPIEQFVGGSELLKGSFQLEFHVRLDWAALETSFFEVVSQGSAGSFYGADEGKRRLRTIVAEHGFETVDAVEATLGALVEALRRDLRDPESAKKSSVEKQLKKGKALKDLFDLLYCLDYLKPTYELRLGGRRLSELSPGERGLLLLVFYLLIDQSRTPLLLDQPEENLDNQSVKRVLVPCIKDAKLRRQIIMVTHNPNLAVVCDAEQIIVASIDKADGNRIEYAAGSIEAPATNKMLLDILEGTQPAFDNRHRKYKVGGSLV